VSAADDKATETAGEDTEVVSPSRRRSKPESSGEATYSVERLIEDAQGFLGCEPHVAAGALYDKSGEMTVDDAKAAVSDWLEREISPPEEE
jgi:hypothetical protein